MRSSTSSSEPLAGRPSKAAWTLLLLLALLAVAAEVATRLVLAPRSAIQNRIARELREARQLREGDVLFAGNSLLLWGADAAQLKQAYAGTRWRFHRFVVEGATIEDWVFGLRQLAHAGSKPSAIFLVLSPGQIAQHAVLGDYFARQLMALSDLPAVASELDLHPTAVAGMALANRSAFYGLRGELRKALLLALIPGLEQLFGLVNRPAQSGSAARPGAKEADRIERHLQQIRKFQTESGIPVVIVIPPLQSDPLAGMVQEASRRSGVRMVTPVPVGAFDSDFFSDGFHLNARGQKRFTPLLADETLRLLAAPGEPR